MQQPGKLWSQVYKCRLDICDIYMSTASAFSLNNKGGHVKVSETLLCSIIMDKALIGRQRELGSRQPCRSQDERCLNKWFYL